MSTQISSPIHFEQLLKATAELPGVRIHRADFLTTVLSPYYDKDVVSRAVAVNPAYAEIPLPRINIIATDQILLETTRATSLSFAAGLPGGIGLLGTIPADLLQYFGHILRILQKLLYLYGWQELFDETGTLDHENSALLTLFTGVMFGVRGADKAVEQIAASVPLRSIRRPSSAAMKRAALEPAATKVAVALGSKLTRNALAKGAAKTFPLLGGVTSGCLTYLTFKPMAKNLQNHLCTLKFADSSPEIIQVDDFEELD